MATLITLSNGGGQIVLDGDGGELRRLRKDCPHLRIAEVEEGWAGAVYRPEWGGQRAGGSRGRRPKTVREIREAARRR